MRFPRVKKEESIKEPVIAVLASERPATESTPASSAINEDELAPTSDFMKESTPLHLPLCLRHLQ